MSPIKSGKTTLENKNALDFEKQNGKWNSKQVSIAS